MVHATIYVIQSSIHHAIQTPYHPFTLPSIHTYHVIHSPCHPVRIMVHAIHLPCHPFTVSASRNVIQALSHPITPRWLDLRSLTRKSSSSCWRPPWWGAPAPWGRSSSPFFACATFPSCLHPPTLPHSTANNIFLTAGAAKTYLFWRPLNYSNLGSNHGRNYSSLALVVFDSILILNLVMPKINSISVVWCGVILKILCKFQSIKYRGDSELTDSLICVTRTDLNFNLN